MAGLGLILAAVVVLGLSGLPAYLFSPRSLTGQRTAAFCMVLGSFLGLAGILLSLTGGQSLTLVLPWFLPWGSFALGIDPLGGLFLGLVFIVPALGSVYGLDYWRQSGHPENGRRLGLAYGLLAASMALVVVARDGLLFLMAWEVMALAAFFAAAIEDDKPEVRRAGWIYLVAAHLGTFCLLAMFALWHRETGSFLLQANQGIGAGAAGGLFLLALAGFGFKAGIMPLHVWLPGAHANAPSHVSAVMSGVMLKMGIYGLVRMSGLLPVTSDWWGIGLLILGGVTAIAGILFALGQQDIKRLLAYSSIENIGIIALGLGLALLGRFWDRWDWVALGLGGALLHVWNHGLFKPLLFLSAGAVIHAAHTREIDRLGGLARTMPRVTMLFLLGAVAIAGLPPLNGFAGEWLLYLGFFRLLAGPEGGAAAAGAAVALALTGALALACFVKLAGAFLGLPRMDPPERTQDPPPGMLMPMAFLAAACAGVGLFPLVLRPAMEAIAAGWAAPAGSRAAFETLAPLEWISLAGLGLLGLVGLILLALRLPVRTGPAARQGTWDCGYAQPTRRMQYTGSSLVQPIAGLYSFVLQPKSHRPRLPTPFPQKASFKVRVPDVVLDRLVLPVFKAVGAWVPRIRVFQQGRTQLYILYLALITIILLALGGVG